MIRLIIIVFVITGYCDLSCGKLADHPDYGIMANTEETHLGAAACPSWMPLGTRLYVEGVGGFTCKDRGGGIVQDRIDLWFPTCEDAMRWGRRKMWVVAILPGGGPR